MDAVQSIQCLEAHGVISEDVAASMKSIVSRLPDGSSAAEAIIMALSLSSNSATRASTVNFSDTPIGSQSITSNNDSDVKTLTPTSGATKALVTAWDNNVMFRLDSSNPVAGSSHFAAQGSNFVVSNMSGFRLASVDSGPVTVFVSYYE